MNDKDEAKPAGKGRGALAGKVIFLTGGSTGIGWACARAYAREGASVFLVANDAPGVARAVADLGSGHGGCYCDVAEGRSVEEAVEACVGQFGRIDAVHNNAGVAHPSKPLHRTTDGEWDRLMDVNVKAILHTLRHSYDMLCVTRGCILNTSSMVGVIGQSDHAAYTATKGAINALTKSMALDYAKDGIRVNAVCPAGVWTPMLRAWAADQTNASEIERYLDDIHPLGPCPEGDVVADACVFLLSGQARFITGHLLHVSGGAEIGYRR